MAKRVIYHPIYAPEGKTIDADASLKSEIQKGWVDSPDKFKINFQTEKSEDSISTGCTRYLSGEIPGIETDNCVNKNWRCKIWNTLASEKPVPGGDRELIVSPRAAGEYSITSRAACWLKLQQHDERFKARLTSWLIDQRRLGFEQPEIARETLRNIEQRKALTVHKRADRLLQYIRNHTPEIGSIVSFTNQCVHAPAMAWSESCNPREVIFLLKYLQSQNWIRDVAIPDSSIGGDYVLTVGGYAHIAEFEKIITISSQAFVAMWFDKSMTSAWEQGIAPAIREAGYEPKRIDREQYNDKIDDEIIASIRRSRFVVADFTQGGDGTRGSVYYEAGFARGLDIPVIFTCRRDALNELHFDTRQYNHIVWENPEELQKALAHRISATIGDGPLKQ